MGANVDVRVSATPGVPGSGDSFVVLGETVDLALSDILYFSFLGDDTATGQPRLCADGSTDELLAVVTVNVAPPDEFASITNADLDQVSEFGLDDSEFLKSDGSEIVGQEWAYTVGPDDAPVRISVSPAIGEESAETAHRWLVKLESTQEVGRATVGFVMPVGVDSTEVQFLGCPPQEFDNTLLCKVSGCPDPFDAAGELGPSVDACNSWVEGPDLEGSGSRIFYISLAGAWGSDSDTGPTLVNVPAEVSREIVQLGTLVLPVAHAGYRPTVTTNGAAAINLREFSENAAFLRPDQTGFDAADSQLAGSGATNPDTDGDGIALDSDFCPNAKDPTNLDDGKLGVAGDATSGEGADGFGNICQCGDGGAGANRGITDDDVVELQDTLLELLQQELPDPLPEADGRCSVSKDVSFPLDELPQDCNIKDVVVVKLALDPLLNISPSQECKKTLPGNQGGGP
jgi:hypothetical protein